MVLVWIAVAFAFGVLEVATVAFFAAFLCLAAVAAAAAAAAGAGLVIQGVAFAAVAAAGTLLARPPLMAYVRRRRGPELLSGAPGLVGQTALVVDPIGGPHRPGHIRIAGEDWPALASDGSAVETGASVKVVGIRQATLLIDKENP